MGFERGKGRGAAPVGGGGGGETETPVAATGLLTVGGEPSGYMFGEGFTLPDGIDDPVNFTWTNTGGIGPGYNGTQIDTGGGPSAAQLAARITAAINAHAIRVTATDNGDGTVSLENDVPGSHGNAAITLIGSFTEGFEVEGMSGGAGDAAPLTAITGLQRSQNLADLPDPEAARVALDVGYGVGSTSGDHGFAVGDTIRGNFGLWEKATADSPSNAAGIVGIVVEVPTSTTFRWAEAGQEIDLSGANEGTLYWLDTVAAGALSPTEPTAPGQVKKLMAIGVGDDRAVVVNGPAIPVQSVAVQAGATLYKTGAAPAAADPDHVIPGFAANGGNMHNGVGFQNPDVPRTLTCTFPADWDGGDVTVPIYDQYGLFSNEVFVAAGNEGTTVAGTKICASLAGNVTKAQVGASASEVTIGTGNTLGLYFPSAGGPGETLVNDANVAWSSAPALIGATVDTLKDAFTPDVVPNGALTYRLLLNVYHRHNLT